MRECVSRRRSWDWAVKSGETDVFVTPRGPVFLWQRKGWALGGLGCVCVLSGVGGEKGLLALKAWTYKGLSEKMMGPRGRKIK